MVSKLEKYFRKLTPKQRKQIEEKLLQIEELGVNGADVAPLVGQKGYYRLRVGKLIRIIFRFENGKPVLIDADDRDKIYDK